jgi:uridine kinase
LRLSYIPFFWKIEQAHIFVGSQVCVAQDMPKQTTVRQKPHLAGITGPSGAGKTELANCIARMLNAPVVSLDRYYRDLAHMTLEERSKQNFDNPAALDHELLFEHLNSLLCGVAVDRPLYDFAHHARLCEVEVVQPGELIILEGLFTFHWENIRNLLGPKIYVAADDLICFERRLARDVRERGRTPESVRLQYETSVRPMAERYIYPTRAFADLVVCGTDPLDEIAAKVLSFLETQQWLS